MALSFEEFERLAKVWNNGQQMMQHEMQKSTLPAPKFRNTVPTLEKVRSSQIMNGTDPASMAIKESQSKNLKAIDRRNLDRKEEAKLKKQLKQEKQVRQEKAKELNNISKTLGDNNASRYNNQFSLDKPLQKVDMKDLRTAQYNKALNDQKMARMNAERKAEADARKANNRQRIEAEVKDLQSKGDLRTMQEDERLNFLLDSAQKRGMTDKDSKYLVSREKYEQMKQGTNLEKDIELLAMATATSGKNKQLGSRQLKDMGYNSVNDYIDQLSKRYELTHDEVKDLVKTFTADRQREQEEKEYNALYNLGQEKTPVANALSMLATPASGAEGWYNTAANILTGDDRYQSNLFSNLSEAPKQGVLDSIDSNAGKTIYNIGLSGAGMGLNAKAGLPALLAMGGNTSNSAMNAAIERGVAPEDAAGLGALAGLADTAFNAQGFNAIDDALKTDIDYNSFAALSENVIKGIKSGKVVIDNKVKSDVASALKDMGGNVLVGAGTEAAENAAQDITETVADELLNGNNSELRYAYQNYVNSGMSPEDAFKQVSIDYAKQIGTSTATGAFGGAIFGSIGMGKELAKTGVDYANYKLSEGDMDIEAEAKAYQDAKNEIKEVPRVGEEPSLIAKNTEVPNQQVIENETQAESAPVSTKNTERIQNYNNTEYDPTSYDGQTITIKNISDSDNAQIQHSKTLTRSDIVTTVRNNIQQYNKQRGIDSNKTLVNSTIGNVVIPNDGIRHGLAKLKKTNTTRAQLEALANLPLYMEDAVLVNEAEGRDANSNAYILVGMYNNGNDNVAVRMVVNEVTKELEDVNVLYALRAKKEGVRGKSTSLNNAASTPSTMSVADYLGIVKDYFPNDISGKVADYYGIKQDKSDIEGLKYSNYNNQSQDTEVVNTEAPTTPVQRSAQEALAASEIYRKDRNGWTYGINNAGDLFVGFPQKGTETYTFFPNTPEGRERANIEWEAGNFAKEVKVKQPKTESESNRVMAEDIGINPETTTDEEPMTIEEPLEDRHPYKEKGVSQFATNTTINSGIFTKEQLDNDPVLSKAKMVASTTNAEGYNEGENRISEGGDKWIDAYNDGSKKIEEAADIHTMMIGMQGLKERIAAAPDEATKAALTAKLNTLFQKGVEATHRGGQFLQALNIWNAATPEGAMLNAEKLAMDSVKDVYGDGSDAKTNRNAKTRESQEIKNRSQKLLNALKKMDEDAEVKSEKKELTLDEVRKQVRNTFDGKYSDLVKDFSDEDFNYVANLLKNGITTDDLSNALKRRFVTGKWGISDTARDQVNMLLEYAQTLPPDSRERITTETKAYQVLADDIYGKDSADFKEKFEAWRYLAMLGNPKTHIRNMIGNAMVQLGLTRPSDTVAAVMEEIADKRYAKKHNGEHINRQKAVLDLRKGSADRALVSGGYQDSNRTYGRWSGNKWNENMRNNIENQRRIFENNGINSINELNSNFLDAEDNIAMSTKYATSIAGYLKANGEDASIYNVEDRIKALKNEKILNPLKSEEIDAELKTLNRRLETLEKAREYAIEKAKYSAFHEDNPVAEGLSEFSNKMKKKGEEGNIGAKLVHYMLEGLLPFKKTPANILRTGFDYSPLHAAKDLQLLHKYNKGYDNVDLADVFDSMSKTLTGTVIMALGALMYDKGVLLSSTDDEKYQDQLEGKQNYSIRLGDYTATIDFAAPAVMPLLLGAEVMKGFKQNGLDVNDLVNALGEKDSEKAINSALDLSKSAGVAMTNLASPMVETSMLQGVNDTLESIGKSVAYGNAGDAIGSLATNLTTGYVTQGIPTLLGQLSRTADNTRRSTYTDSMLGTAKQIEKLQNKTPLSFFNEPYIDAHGRTQSNSPTDNLFGRALYQLLSPSYISKVNETAGDKVARDVYNVTKDSKVFSDWASSKKIDGKKISPQDYTTYMTIRGEADTAIRDYLAQNEWFMSLSPYEKNDILTGIASLTDKIGEEAINPNFEKKDKALAAYHNGLDSLVEYYKGKSISNQTKEITGDLSTSSNAFKEVKEKVASGDIEGAEQLGSAYDQLKDLGASTAILSGWDNASQAFPTLDPPSYYKQYKEIDSLEKNNGKISMSELESYINKNAGDDEDYAQTLWNAYYGGWKNKAGNKKLLKKENGKYVSYYP